MRSCSGVVGVPHFDLREPLGLKGGETLDGVGHAAGGRRLFVAVGDGLGGQFQRVNASHRSVRAHVSEGSRTQHHRPPIGALSDDAFAGGKTWLGEVGRQLQPAAGCRG